MEEKRKSPVAVDVCVEMAELPEQRALGLGIARVECAHLGDEQVVEEERQRSGDIPVPVLPTQGGRNAPSPFLGFLAGHNRPTDGFGVCENPGLDGFVLGGGGHVACSLGVSRQTDPASPRAQPAVHIAQRTRAWPSQNACSLWNPTLQLFRDSHSQAFVPLPRE